MFGNRASRSLAYWLGKDSRRWKAAREASRGGPRVLIATSTGGHPAVTPVESALAVALTLRGANVHVLLCDELLPACLQATFSPESHRRILSGGPQAELCPSCFSAGRAIFEPLGLPLHLYSQCVEPGDKVDARALAGSMEASAIPSYKPHGLAVGEHALAGALRYFAKGTLEDEPDGEAILRRYFEASLMTTRALGHLLDREAFSALCFHHGIYVPLGLIGEVARKRGLRVVNWNPSYRKQTFIFSHGDTYHHTLLDEPTSQWESVEWRPDLEARTLEYLRSRWQGSQDWIWFHEKPEQQLQKIVAELGLDLGKPSVGLLSNVIWDAQLHYPANAFPNMVEWVNRTIQYFAGRPTLQLIIRVHPAEVNGTVPSRQRLIDEIVKRYPQLPANVVVVPPDSSVSTYALMEVCDSVLIYGTKTGVELTSMGIPVVVAGEAWIRNKGVTMDAASADDYFRLLDRLPMGRRLDVATTQRARKYAYHFFFRRMIPLSMMKPTGDWPPYRLELPQLADLEEGRDPGLDVVCNGILDGTEFVYEDENN